MSEPKKYAALRMPLKLSLDVLLGLLVGTVSLACVATSVAGEVDDTWQKKFWIEYEQGAGEINPGLIRAMQIIGAELLVPYDGKKGIRPLTNPVPGTFLASFAPDGETVAFARMGETGPEVVLMNRRQKQAKLLLAEEHPVSVAFSPDGTSLAIASLAENASLKIISVADAGRKTLLEFPSSWQTHGELSMITSCVWLDETHVVAYVVRLGALQIEMIDTTDARRTVLFDSAGIEEKWPPFGGLRFQPDDLRGWTSMGEALSVTQDGDIYFCWLGAIFHVNAKTEQADLVADCIMRDGYSNPKVAPSGERFFFLALAPDTIVLSYRRDLTRGCLIASFHARRPPFSADWANWLPDGKYVAVACNGPIVIASADGKRRATLPQLDEARKVELEKEAGAEMTEEDRASLAEGLVELLDARAVWPVGSDSLGVLSNGSIWLLDISDAIKNLDVMREPEEKLKYPDLSSPESTLATVTEATKRGDTETLFRCFTPKVQEEYRRMMAEAGEQAERRKRAMMQSATIGEAVFDPDMRSVEVEGNTATVLIMGKPRQRLVKSGAIWQIAPFDDQ